MSGAGTSPSERTPPTVGNETAEVSDLVRRLLDANKRFAAEWSGDYPVAPTLGLVVVACMDARVLPSQFFAIGPGDAHILRTAGGRVTDDVIRSLIASTNMLGCRTVVVVHHTDCGMASRDQAGVVDAVLENVGRAPNEIDFLTIDDPRQALVDDVARIRACPYLPADLEIVGGIIDVRTGELDVQVVDRHA